MARLLLLNFGTFAETHRFKALANAGGYIEDDAFDAASPGDLVQAGGVQRRSDLGAALYSFYGLTGAMWKSKLDSGTAFKDAFDTWARAALAQPVHAVYIAGHHWTGSMHMSWGEENSDFYAEFDPDKQVLAFGVSADRIELDTQVLRSDCKLVVGFGCNVATAVRSAQYQSFFDSRPVILAWDRSIAIPKRSQPSVNARFFQYLDGQAASNAKVPKTERINWFYDHDSMQLVRAWGFATANWFADQARARDKDGAYYRFRLDKKTGDRVPERA